MALALSSVQGQESKAPPVGIVSAQLANVHDSPLPKSHIVTQVLLGDEVHLLEKQDYRYRIAIPAQNNREGWIQQAAITIPKDRGRSYLDGPRSFIVVSAPKTEALILDRTGDHKVPVYGGTRLPVTEKLEGGYKVQFPDRTLAIIDAADAMPIKNADPLLNDTSAEELGKTARRFIGVRQKTGGLTTQGMDIPGLMYIVYRIHGIHIGTDRAWLREHAEQVERKDIQAGDVLVFFGEKEGLAIDSNRFLEAEHKRTVQVAGIHDRRYANSVQYGLRIIGADPGQRKAPAMLAADELLLSQARASRLSLGRRIAYWAGRFVGTPYDPDPLGLYVRTNRIVADEKVDCMYLTFRAVELALSSTPAEAVDRALTYRFLTQGAIADGLVTNYDQRFQYGEDMVFSGKWGTNMTEKLGTSKTIPGSRGKEEVPILPKQVLQAPSLQKKLQNGDIVFWVKDPKKRSTAEEIVAHLAIVHIKGGKPHLIHAAGDKAGPGRTGGGVVKELPFEEYVRNMRFIGAFITRFEQQSYDN